MKMNAKALAPIAIVAAFGLGTLAPHAQSGAGKVGFVDADALLAAHPKNADAQKNMTPIQNKMNTELGDLDKQIRAIDAKGTAATAAEKDQRTKLVETFNAKANNYQKQLEDLSGPITNAVDKAIGDYAKANGFSIIMDRKVAAASQLVVYAEPTLDVTEAVKKNVK